MGIGSIGGYQPQAYVTPLNSGPTALQRTQDNDPAQQVQAAADARKQQQDQANQDQQSKQASTSGSGGGSGGGYTTPTRGQNLNITA